MPVVISAAVVLLFVSQHSPLWVLVAVIVLLILHGTAFVLVRYAAQVVSTARYFDQLALDYVASPERHSRTQ